MWNLEHSIVCQLSYDWGLDAFNEGTLKQKKPWEFQWNKIGKSCLDETHFNLKNASVCGCTPLHSEFHLPCHTAVWAESSTGSVYEFL